MLSGLCSPTAGRIAQGEDVHVKAVLRHDATDGTTPLAPGTKLDVRVNDSRNREVDHRVGDTNRWSSIDWTWQLPADAALGSLQRHDQRGPGRLARHRACPRQQLNSREIVRGSFLVAAYRRPDFRVDATMTADPPVLGRRSRASSTRSICSAKALESQPVHW